MLNKWRIEQFCKNNKPDKSPDKDFACLSPKSGKKDQKSSKEDLNVVFLSDSDGNSHEKQPPATESFGLLEIKWWLKTKSISDMR